MIDVTTKDSEITTIQVAKTALNLATMLVGDVTATTRQVCTIIDQLAIQHGAEVVCQEGKIILQKQINNRVYDIITYDPVKQEVRCVVDVYRKYRGSISTPTGITAEQFKEINGVNVVTLHEVRGPMDYLLGTEGRTITRADGTLAKIKMVMREAKLPKGDIVRYNTWDFSEYALYRAKLENATIEGESPEHKRAFIKKLAADYCSGTWIPSEGKISPEVENILRRVNAGEISPDHLPGYEIHHDGYGEMLFLPNDIHCRKLSHIGGSWLMNEQHYVTLRESKLASVQLSNAEVQTADISTKRLSVTDICNNVLDVELPNIASEWYEMSIDRKKWVLTKFANILASELKITNFVIEFKMITDTTCCGFFESQCKHIIPNRSVNYMLINSCLLHEESQQYVIQTILHEMYHAVQHEAINSPTKYDISQFELEVWSENLAHYITPELDYQEYIKQPVEYTAEKFAHDLTDKYFANYV